MSKIDNIATELNNHNKDLVKKVKNHAFDVVAVGLVLAVGILGLGAIGIRRITIGEIFNMLMEAVPFYLGSVMLSLNYYKKGVYSGKLTGGFINIVKLYSEKVTKLTGKQIDVLNDFCREYNHKALRMMQEAELHTLALSFERFDSFTIDENSKEIKPLKITPYEDLVKIYGKEIADGIEKIKKIKVKGLSANLLLGNLDSCDMTDLGLSEQEMLTKRSRQYAIVCAVLIILMTLMAVKNVLEWGWMGAFLIAFKMIYIFCRSYMKYFEGYDDITIKLTNHISRKTDIIKQFYYWYDEKYSVEQKVETSVISE